MELFINHCKRNWDLFVYIVREENISDLETTMFPNIYIKDLGLPII